MSLDEISLTKANGKKKHYLDLHSILNVAHYEIHL